MNENPTARQQFVRDISLVIDNDYETYNLTRDEAKRLNDVYQLAEFLKEFVETQIENAIGNNLIGAQLIREICNGYGTDAYADYARDIMAELAENAGV